ncbi:MAG: hypothetical protein V4812_19160 [Pseudomonadota bacterium]
MTASPLMGCHSINKGLLVLALAATSLAACVQFEPLQTVPSSIPTDQRVVPAEPVYGVVSYEMPLIMAPSSSPKAAPQGQVQELPPRTEPGLEALREARLLQASGDQAGMLKWLHQAADEGSAQAHLELALHYQNDVDQQAALTHLSRADAMGHAEATRVLAWHYLKGQGVAMDIAYGTRLLEKAAWGSTRAQREAGLLYLNIYTPNLNDSARGLELLKAASESGDTPAQAFYKHVLDKPNTPPRVPVPQTASEAPAPGLDSPSPSNPDPDSAMTVDFGPIGEPAITPPAPAQPEASAPLLQAPPGAGIDEDPAEATKRAALAGDLDAMCRYADQVLSGQSPSIEPELEAYAWLAVAADRGSQHAARQVVALDGVRAATEQRRPGELDARIAALNQVIAPPSEQPL